MSNDLDAIRNDPAAVTEAIRRLVEVAVAEDTSLIDRTGGWPDEVRHSPVAALILHPVASACRRAVDALVAHLATLVGEAAANAQLAAIVAEQTSAPEVRDSIEKAERASGKPVPSTPRSVH